MPCKHKHLLPPSPSPLTYLLLIPFLPSPPPFTSISISSPLTSLSFTFYSLLLTPFFFYHCLSLFLFLHAYILYPLPSSLFSSFTSLLSPLIPIVFSLPIFSSPLYFHFLYRSPFQFPIFYILITHSLIISPIIHPKCLRFLSLYSLHPYLCSNSSPHTLPQPLPPPGSLPSP